MALTPGQRLGAYEVLGSLGKGGMGEVYRARDTKLQREVAIKVLPESLATDRDRLARFEREAQLLAALNHPNIAAIYGVDTVGDTQFLVLELVEGDTLADRISRGGALSLSEALALARQIGEALQAAHDKGIIHRDLKPANIALTADGQVKVLDFGLAKAIEKAPAAQTSTPAATHSPTLSLAMTEAGFILGTAAYMSPEQAKGRPADKRSDVWAFGCVLFEMLTGKRAFEGEDASDTLAGILRGEPDWKALPRGTPPHIRDVLAGCLTKDRKARLAEIAVVNYLLADGRHPKPATDAPTRRQTLGLAAAALMLAAGNAATWWLMRDTGGFHPVTLLPFVPPREQPMLAGNGVAISGDGQTIAYVAAQGQLVLRHLDRKDVEPLPGIAIGAPFFSFDGKWIGFAAGNFELRKVPVTGGASAPVASLGAQPRGASWGPDGTIVFATADASTGLFSVPAGGGEPEQLTFPDTASGEIDHIHPSYLPDGRGVLFTITTGSNSLNPARIAVLNLQTGKVTRLMISGGTNPAYVEPGYLVYVVAGALRAVRFDQETLSVIGDPIVIDRVAMPNSGAPQYAVSRTGDLIYVTAEAGANSGSRTLVWVDRKGTQTPIVGVPPRAYQYPRLSHDEKLVALSISDLEQDIWIFNLASRTLTQVTFDPAVDMQATWYPGDDRILFSSTRSGPANLFSQRVDGTGTVERVTESLDNQLTTTMSATGKYVVFLEQHAGRTGNDLMLLTLEPSAAGSGSAPVPSTGKGLKPKVLIQSTGTQAQPEISPGGRLLAYMSTETGQPQIVVRAFPDLNGRWNVSTAGGSRPAWTKGGKELIYVGPGGAMMAVPVEPTPTFSHRTAVKLFDWPTIAVPGQARTYDVSRDGEKFLMIKEAGTDQGAAPATISVVRNWAEQLKRKLPAN